MTRSLSQAASSYFAYLALHFPVMCASDEFHFVPRAQQAAEYYHSMEDLDARRIEEHIAVLQDYQAEFRRLSSPEDEEIEEAIDRELLKASVAGILLELSHSRAWQHNPLLYLKIAFIGLDHALNKPYGSMGERRERTLSRLNRVPMLLRQAADNLEQVPAAYWQAALHMAHDCDRYLFEIPGHFPDHLNAIAPALEGARFAVGRFIGFLGSIRPVRDEKCAAPSVEMVLRDHFGSLRTLREVFDLAREEWFECLAGLRKLQKGIDEGKTWEELYHAYVPKALNEWDTLTLYRGEMKSLQAFFREHGFEEFTDGGLPEIVPTPVYLESVRSSASFSAAFTEDEREKDFFYITTELPDRRGEEASVLLRKRLHREFRFLTAHETFPGHFLLDSTRRRLPSPVRRQIESPLFYEGWAYYVESLLTESGYVDDPLECLVDWKRRLWRAARCQIDVGLNVGLISWEDAVKLLTKAGFSREESENQVRRFRLNPGYQLCYSLGRYEIVKLRDLYCCKVGRNRFHGALLTGGEIPFQFIEERLRRLCAMEQ